jgi:hypothetical protein
MKYRFLAGICFVCSSLFLGCIQPESHDLSVEGIWICTTETAFDFPESKWITALLIGEDKDGNIEARGCFMWDGSYLNPWELEQASFNGDSLALDTLLSNIISQDYGRLESLLVMKDSMLVMEEYFYGYDRIQQHNIHSVTKSIASLMLGIVMDQHEEVELTTPLFDFFPEYDSLAKIGQLVLNEGPFGRKRILRLWLSLVAPIYQQ